MTEKQQRIEKLERLSEYNGKIVTEISKAIIGQKKVINEILIALFANGHCLVEGVPGLAKTTLIATLAKALNLKFNRIQFTPDLMPSDITGTDILAENKIDGKRYFEYIRGPIFTNIVLADEINRTPPKTQAALLQAMQEYHVTAGNNTYKLEQPFLVLATQNPIEQEGTYPLPEAQLDRFMFNINIYYPTYEEEKQIVLKTTGIGVDEIEPILSGTEIIEMQKLILSLPVSEHVLDYAVKIARLTRPGEKEAPDFINKWVSWGAGPRASLYLTLAAKTKAALDGRPTPSEQDVKSVATIVLQHRLLVSFAAEAEGITAKTVIQKLIEHISS